MEAPDREVLAPGAAIDLDQLEADLAAVERALQDLDRGTYGTCQRCGARIDDQLLAAHPLASHCADHS